MSSTVDLVRFSLNLNIFFPNIFEKYDNNFHQNLSSGSRIVPCGRTDGRTDGHDEAKSLFAILRTRLKRITSVNRHYRFKKYKCDHK
jgi:hypothetical protein